MRKNITAFEVYSDKYLPSSGESDEYMNFYRKNACCEALGHNYWFHKPLIVSTVHGPYPLRAFSNNSTSFGELSGFIPWKFKSSVKQVKKLFELLQEHLICNISISVLS